MANIRFGYTPTHPGEVIKDETADSLMRLQMKYNMQETAQDPS